MGKENRSNIDFERFLSLLEGLRDVLLKHDMTYAAQLAADLHDLAHLESPTFIERIQGGQVWGKGLADVVLIGNVPGPEDTLRRDDEKYRRLLVRLAEKMARQGINTPRSDLVEWGLRKGLGE